MKVLFQSHYDIGRMYGGGPTVINMLAENLKSLGVDITFHDYWKHNPKNFDLIHYFSCIGAENWLRHRDDDPPLLVTPISWFYFPLRKRIGETVKFFARAALHLTTDKKKLGYTFAYPRFFYPNSEGEAIGLQRSYGISRDRMRIIPHGVPDFFAKGDGDLFKKTNGLGEYILCVGRFEYPRKNQLMLIRALRSAQLPIIFIGGPEPGFESYYEQCRNEASPRMKFLSALPYGDPMQISAYHGAKVVVMPALLESPGLTGLEGALGRANIAATQYGSTREYFGEHAFYFDPRNPQSIRKEVLSAWEAPQSTTLRQKVLSTYTWKVIAQTQLKAYTLALDKK